MCQGWKGLLCLLSCSYWALQGLAAGDDSLQMVDANGVRLLAEADGPIGLQACELHVKDGSLFGADGPLVFDAGAPWWRHQHDNATKRPVQGQAFFHSI